MSVERLTKSQKIEILKTAARIKAQYSVLWAGNEDEEYHARQKACDSRCKQYKCYDDCDRDGSCAECEEDMAMELAVEIDLGSRYYRP